MKKTILMVGMTLAIVAMLVLPTPNALAQGKAPGKAPAASTGPLVPAHLNPAVAKLAAGQPMIGLQTQDTSLQNCHAISRVKFDYVYFDMEHGPFDLPGLAFCVAAMVDKAAAIKNGNAAAAVALFARFPAYGRDTDSNDWVAKQALDMGLMGVIFNGTDNAQQASREVQYMRYPQKKTSEHPLPPGIRGTSPGNAVFAWGISGGEYERRADVWPLNPEGDLLCIPMIETADGLKNANEIAATPGVGAIFIGAGGDLHQYLGVESANGPETEAARQQILSACKAHKVACGITAVGKANVDKRLQEGWMMIRTGQGE